MFMSKNGPVIAKWETWPSALGPPSKVEQLKMTM